MSLNETTLAAFIGIIFALLKISEKGISLLFEWLKNKRDASSSVDKKSETTMMVVQLDPQASAAIADTLYKVEKIQEIIERRDSDGTPLVYFPRSCQERMLKGIEEVKQEVWQIASKS